MAMMICNGTISLNLGFFYATALALLFFCFSMLMLLQYYSVYLYVQCITRMAAMGNGGVEEVVEAQGNGVAARLVWTPVISGFVLRRFADLVAD